MKNLVVAFSAGASCLCIAAAVFYLAPEKPRAASVERSSPREAVESERNIAEARERETAFAAAVPAPESRPEAGTSGQNYSRLESGDLTEAEARLEKIAARLEQRMEQLEKQMKNSGLIPMTLEERAAEMQREKARLAEMQAQLDAENAEVRRLALLLNVPDAVAKLSPYEAVNDPLYQRYRAYLEAKKRAGHLQQFATDQEGKVLGLEFACT